jgi:uracil-DNA glycosylase
MIEVIKKSWPILAEEFDKDYFKSLGQFLYNEYQTKTCYPKLDDIFNAFKLTPFDEVKVVIIGQDPYPHDHAHGLAFSSLKDSIPSSLRVIYKDLIRDLYNPKDSQEFIDIQKSKFNSANLESWAKQGVFLLNTVLTVREKEPNSHVGKGWEKFTQKAISVLSSKPVVFMLWGKHAQNMFDKSGEQHKDSLILKAGHPATSLYGNDTFSGNNHFKKCNKYLKKNNKKEIAWEVC